VLPRFSKHRGAMLARDSPVATTNPTRPLPSQCRFPRGGRSRLWWRLPRPVADVAMHSRSRPQFRHGLRPGCRPSHSEAVTPDSRPQVGPQRWSMHLPVERRGPNPPLANRRRGAILAHTISRPMPTTSPDPVTCRSRLSRDPGHERGTNARPIAPLEPILASGVEPSDGKGMGELVRPVTRSTTTTPCDVPTAM
jgi:hypothetical protein